MAGSFRKRGCKCPKGKKKCTCGAKWYYRYDITDPSTGKRKQKEIGGFNTKAEAEEKAKEIQYELIVGTYVEEKDITFEAFSQEWLQDYENSGKVKISTVRVRKHEIGRLMPFFKHVKMKDVTRLQYQRALKQLKNEGYADNTLDGIHSTGRKIFKKAIELELIKNDPTEYAFVPKKQKTLEEIEAETDIPKYLEKEELALFLEIAKDKGLTDDYRMFLVLAYTGIRVGELCALKWSDIDFEGQTISISKTYYNPTNIINKYTLLPPKTKSSKRIIDVDKYLLDELRRHKSEQKELIMSYRKKHHNGDFVFTLDNEKYIGYPCYTKRLGLRMNRLLKLANLNANLTPHSLRHTHTSLLAEAGVSLETIMQRLGHSDDKTTKNVYLHVTKPLRKEASQKFAELMRSF